MDSVFSPAPSQAPADGHAALDRPPVAPPRARPLRILHIVESAATGVGRHLLDLLEGTLARGHGADVLFSPTREDDIFRQGRARLGTVRFRAIAMRRAPNPMDLKALWAVRRHMASFGPYDIIHGHSSKGGMLARLAGIGTTAKVVYTPHAISTLDPTLGRLKRAVYTAGEVALAHLTDGVIAVSTGERAHIVSLGIPAVRVTTIPNAIEPPVPAPRADTRRELGLAPGHLAIGFVGRLTAHKGIDILISAFARAHAAAPHARLIIIGDGPWGDEARGQAETLGCATAITWLGARDAVRFYSAFDLLAQPSRYEGLSYTLLEAAAVGLPILATDVGGTRDVIDDDVTGVVAPAPGRRAETDGGAFGTLLTRLVTDPGRLARHAAAASARVAPGGQARMVTRTLSLYQSLISKAG
ncbi:glycosyltransferase [Nitrospirillum iridis]|uniref:Glycosyltransferase involved in cell wall biosynthesis n=1 Tax=Nitrospirillum iridis TaxID=765888 RepID=A0A7X0B0Z3_9PROT|nr:glycosyltransferase [Nitrospirillum iridis]MBB6253670.1 glycosyltransferase involved in cell wall biosynthesis [Nitrospirillum iridis]